MYYIVSSDKSLYEATVDLRAAILRLGFGILQVQELGTPGSGWEVNCDEDCTAFSVESPRLTERLLASDMRCVLALPWRISVYTEDGATRIGFMRPSALFAALQIGQGLTETTRETEERLRQIVDEARS